MFIIAGGIVLGWLCITVIRTVLGHYAGPTPEELLAEAERIRRIGR